MIDRQVIELPCVFDAANRKKDRSLSLRLTTSMEVTNADFAAIDRLVGTSGYFLFAANRFEDADIPTKDAPTEGKTQAQRIRGLLWHAWDQNTDKSEDFEAYYRRRTNLLIDVLKQELD